MSYHGIKTLYALFKYWRYKAILTPKCLATRLELRAGLDLFRLSIAPALRLGSNYRCQNEYIVQA